MPRTTKILIITIVILFILSLIFYSAQKPNPQINQQPQTTPANDSQMINTSIKNLLANGKPLKCTTTAQISNISVSGTLYVSDNKIRGDFQPQSIPVNINGHLIINSKKIYLWTNQSDQGVTFPIDSEIAKGQGNNKALNIDQPIPLSCSPWEVDNSLFALPTGINFQPPPTPITTPNSNK